MKADSGRSGRRSKAGLLRAGAAFALGAGLAAAPVPDQPVAHAAEVDGDDDPTMEAPTEDSGPAQTLEGVDPGSVDTPPPPTHGPESPDAEDDALAGQEETGVVSPQPPPAAPQAQAAPSPPAAAPPAPPAPPPTPAAAPPPAPDVNTTPERPRPARGRPHVRPPSPAVRAHPPAPPPPSPEPAVEPAPPVRTAATRSAGPARPGGRYVVSAGDTLWGIARSLVGEAASDASVARTVDRLWALNAPAIGSGDPDLIRPGVELRLPASRGRGT